MADGFLRDPHDFGDLAIGQVLKVREHERLAGAIGEVLDCLLDGLLDLSTLEPTKRCDGRDAGQVEPRARSPNRRAPQLIDEAIPNRLIKVGAHRSRRIEIFPMLVQENERVLHHVFRRVDIASKPKHEPNGWRPQFLDQPVEGLVLAGPEPFHQTSVSEARGGIGRGF